MIEWVIIQLPHPVWTQGRGWFQTTEIGSSPILLAQQSPWHSTTATQPCEVVLKTCWLRELNQQQKGGVGKKLLVADFYLQQSFTKHWRSNSHFFVVLTRLIKFEASWIKSSYHLNHGMVVLHWDCCLFWWDSITVQGWTKVTFPGSANMRWNSCVFLPATGAENAIRHADRGLVSVFSHISSMKFNAILPTPSFEPE